MHDYIHHFLQDFVDDLIGYMPLIFICRNQYVYVWFLFLFFGKNPNFFLKQPYLKYSYEYVYSSNTVGT